MILNLPDSIYFRMTSVYIYIYIHNNNNNNIYIYIFVYTSYFLIKTHQHQVSKVRPWPVRLATLGCCPGNPGNLLSGSSLVMTNSLP